MLSLVKTLQLTTDVGCNFVLSEVIEDKKLGKEGFVW